MTHTKDEALRLALEALDSLLYWDNGKPEYDEARASITAIKQALADSALDRMAENARELGLDYEPVATVTSETGNPDVEMSWWHEPALPIGTKLYTTPPAAQPAPAQSCYCLNCEELSKQITALKLFLEVERGFREQEQPAQGEKK
jgi:hypothetical protein